MRLNWKTGFEIELLAPRRHSRLDLARRVADAARGSTRRLFHAQAELSKVPGKPTFESLSPGFEAVDAEGNPIARFVDDVTLVADLDPRAEPLPDWYRIVTDDKRLVRLIIRNCDARAPLETVLQPIADMFGTVVEHPKTGLAMVSDDRGVSVAIAAALPSERERGCEIITPPLETGQEKALEALFSHARAGGFLLPFEGATHIHFDAERLQSARTVVRLVKALSRHGARLKRITGTNSNCIRLGEWPDALLALVGEEGFADLDWPQARKALGAVGLEKYCDFNLLNMVAPRAAQSTFELRILPSGLEAEPIIAAAELFVGIFNWCIDASGQGDAPSNDFHAFLAALPLSSSAQARWMGARSSSLPAYGAAAGAWNNSLKQMEE